MGVANEKYMLIQKRICRITKVTVENIFLPFFFKLWYKLKTDFFDFDNDLDTDTFIFNLSTYLSEITVLEVLKVLIPIVQFCFA